jgi:hypothetical protein
MKKKYRITVLLVASSITSAQSFYFQASSKETRRSSAIQAGSMHLNP